MDLKAVHEPRRLSGGEAHTGEAFRTHVESGARAEAVAVEIDLAALESATGEPERARKLLEQAASAANAMKAPPADQALLALARADLAIKFGTFADADSQYSRAVRLYREARDSSGIGQALQGKRCCCTGVEMTNWLSHCLPKRGEFSWRHMTDGPLRSQDSSSEICCSRAESFLQRVV